VAFHVSDLLCGLLLTYPVSEFVPPQKRSGRHAQVSKPAEVAHVEQKSVSDTVVLRTITDWNVAVAAVNRTLRGLLPAYDGYECKEPEPGKFTLTFRCVPGRPSTH